MIPVLPDRFGSFVGRVLESSLEAGLLVCAILAVLLLAGRRIPARWRHALWLLVLLRLILPWTPESRYSVYGFLPQLVRHSATVSSFQEPPPDRNREQTASAAAIKDGAYVTNSSGGIVAGIWLAGAAVCASWILMQALSAALAFNGRRPVTDQAVLELLESCKDELGIRTYLAIIETPSVRSPALFGWIRPRLLLPAGVLARLRREQLRHVFLHELAHLKRHDIALNWLIAGIQTLHWFNPLVWLAFHKARLDMELACDEMALARLEEQESSDYGDTLLDLLEDGTCPQRVPMLAAIGEETGQVRRRIQMVAAFKSNRNVSSLVPAAILLVLGIVFLVDARNPLPAQAAGLGLAISAPTPSQMTESGSALSKTPETQTPAIDAAMRAAADWLTVQSTGSCSQAWAQSHSVVKGMMSREAYSGLCKELLGELTDKYGAFVSVKAVQVEYVPNLPMGLGDGVSISFQSKYQAGSHYGPKIIVAKDTDGVWRMVRLEFTPPAF
jgi:bla regulator protein BlaR1